MVKLKDVAEAAGVTIATVSIALSGKGRVSSSTRERVCRIADEMNYRPSGQTGRSQSSGVDVGLIIADNQNMIIHDFIKFTETYHLRNQLEFVYNDGSSMSLPVLLNRQAAKGILHIGYIGDGIRRYLSRNPDLPFVAINDTAEYSVKTDFTAGVHRAMQYLLALGHRKIAFYSGSEKYAVPRIFNRAIAKCIQEYDLDRSEHFLPCHFDGSNSLEYMNNSLKWARQILHSKNRPTACFCSGLMTARAVIYVAMESGLRIPEDLSVLALGDEGDASNSYPFVTTISENYPLLTSTAMMMLQRRISGLSIEEKNINIDTGFVVRGSTGPNREGKQ